MPPRAPTPTATPTDTMRDDYKVDTGINVAPGKSYQDVSSSSNVLHHDHMRDIILNERAQRTGESAGCLCKAGLQCEENRKDIFHACGRSHAREFQTKNPYLTHGFRVDFSWGLLWRTALNPGHNQCCNVFTHSVIGFPAVLFAYLYFVVYNEVPLPWFFHANAAGIFGMCCASSLYHIFADHSALATVQFLTGDQLAVVILVVTSFFPAMHFMFPDSSTIQGWYQLMICMFGLLVVVVSTIPFFRKPERQFWRTQALVALSGAGILPITHSIVRTYFLSGIISAEQITIVGAGLRVCGKMLLEYLVGLTFFIGRIPERFWPGYLTSMWLGSHPIWHIIVLVTAIRYLHHVTLLWAEYMV